MALKREKLEKKKTQKKAWTRGLLTGLAGLIFLSLAPRVWASDYEGHPAAQDIDQALADGLVSLEEGDFRPDQPILIKEYARLVNGFLALNKIAPLPYENLEADHDYYEDLMVAKEAGYLLIDDEEGLKPDDPLARDRAVAGVARLFSGLGQKDASLILVDDMKEVDIGLREDVRLALEKKWVDLDEENRFYPKKDMTRAQALVFLSRLTGLRLYEDQLYGDAVQEDRLASNISIYGQNVTLQKISSDQDILVFSPASGGKLILNRSQLAGDLLVFGVKDLSVELRQSNLGRLINSQTSGPLKVSRDASSHIENFVEVAPIDFSVLEEEASGEGLEVRGTLYAVVAASLLLLVGLVFSGHKEKKHNYFITRGSAKYVSVDQAAHWPEVEIINDRPDLVLVERRSGKFRMEGLRKGRAKIRIRPLRKEDPDKGSLDPALGAKNRKVEGLILQVVVVDRPGRGEDRQAQPAQSAGSAPKEP